MYKTPENLNCLSPSLTAETFLVLEHAARDDACKVLICASLLPGGGGPTGVTLIARCLLPPPLVLALTLVALVGSSRDGQRRPSLLIRRRSEG